MTENRIKRTQIKLTAYYVVTALSVSILFSMLIYGSISTTVKRALIAQQNRQQRMMIEQMGTRPIPRGPMFDPDTLEEIQEQTLFRLIIFNILIGIAAGIAGYFLSSRSLKPVEEMIERQKQFLSDVSHELKTPIAVMNAEIDVALMSKDYDKKIQNLLKSIKEELAQLTVLNNQLLKQEETALKKQHKEPIDLKEIITTAVQSVDKIATQKNIKIIKNGQSVQIMGNKSSLEELFVILLDNAIKFSKKNSNIRIKWKQKNNFVEIEFIDEGIGITKEEQARIFDRFYKTENSRNKDGFGLGLSIAQSIVSFHNGEITVNSTPNKGSTFIVKLPL